MSENHQENLQRVGVHLGQFIQASSLCLNQGLPIPAFVLLFSMIDVAAGMHAGFRTKKSKDRFLAWSAQYVLASSDICCSAMDLYGARCGLVHSASPDSTVYRRGEAKQIWYAFHAKEAKDLKRQLSDAGESDVIVLSVEALASATSAALIRFINDLETTPVLASYAADQLNEAFQFAEMIDGELKEFPTLESLSRLAEKIQREAS